MRALPGWLRNGLAVALAGVAFVLLVMGKRDLLSLYLSAEPWSAFLVLGALVAVVEGARRGLKASGWAAWGAGAPLLAVLLVLVVSTPLPFELAAEARKLPHPGGAVAPEEVQTAAAFERRHPVATVVFRYGMDRDLAALTNGTADAFRAEGWTVTTASLPEGMGPEAFGYVAAERAPFVATCTLGQRAYPEGPMRTVGCRLTV